MEWTQDQIAAIIGSKELQLIELRIALGQAQQKIEELTPKPPTPDKGSSE